MYYQSKGLKEFTKPSPLSRPIMLAWINGPFTPEAIKERCEDAVAAGLGGFFPIPIPKQFAFAGDRNAYTALDQEYLSDEYFQRYDILLNEARERGLHIWLYDEGGYPSGTAAGNVLKSNPDLCSRVLRYKAIEVRKGKGVNIPAKSKFVFFYVSGRISLIKTRGRWKAPADGKMGVIIEEIWGYTDLLRADTTEKFIELTHQQYYQHSKDHFGSTIPCAFTDEARLPGCIRRDIIPWTPLMLDEFKKRKGYDLADHLAGLFQPPGQMTDAEKQVRIDFMDVVTSLHAENYYGVLKEWCQKHGILSSGHLGGEDQLIGTMMHGFGHPMRMYRKMHVPGVDFIWRQVWLDRRTLDFPKYASSVAHQIGSDWVSNDTLGVYGNGITLQENKFLYDYFLVRGVNFFIEAHTNFSTRDGAMDGCHPIADRNADPFWRHKPLFNEYVARVATMMAAGKPRVKTALYYPIRDLWAEIDGSSLAHQDGLMTFVEGPAVIRSIETASQEMLTHQRDYDYVDDDVLADISGEKGTIAMGSVSYDTLVISAVRFLPPLSARKISQFVKSGGKLIILDDVPRVAPEKGASLYTLLNLDDISQGTSVKRGKGEVIFRNSWNFADVLTPLVELVPACPEVRVAARDLEDGSVFFFLTNEVLKAQKFIVRLPDKGSVLQLDPLTGWIERLSSKKVAGKREVEMALAPLGSALLLAGKQEVPLKCEWMATGDSMDLNQGWEICPARRYMVGQHEFEIHALREKWHSCSLGRWSRFLGDDFSGDAKYRVIFNCPKILCKQQSLLSLGRVESVAEVVLNGKRIGKRIWEPFEFDLEKGTLVPGKNTLDIVVTNSLAAELNSARVRKDWASRKGPGWPGNYDNCNHIFEKDSLELGGLIGPVVIAGRKSDG